MKNVLSVIHLKFDAIHKKHPIRIICIVHFVHVYAYGAINQISVYCRTIDLPYFYGNYHRPHKNVVKIPKGDFTCTRIPFAIVKFLLFTTERRVAHLRQYDSLFPLSFASSLSFFRLYLPYYYLPCWQFFFKCENWYSRFFTYCDNRNVTVHRKGIQKSAENEYSSLAMDIFLCELPCNLFRISEFILSLT